MRWRCMSPPSSKRIVREHTPGEHDDVALENCDWRFLSCLKAGRCAGGHPECSAGGLCADN